MCVCRYVLEKDEHLVQEMAQAGLVAAPTSQLFMSIKHELSEYARRHPLYDGARKKEAAGAGAGAAVEEAEVGEEEDGSSSDSSDAAMDSVEDVQELLARPIFRENGLLVNKPPPGKHKPEEWAKLVSRYFKSPGNTLERDREAYYQERHHQKSMHLDDCRSEADLLLLQRQRYVCMCGVWC